MVRTADGRRIYDQIMSGPAHETCPLCGHGIVKTLDHYLPKRVFPVLCVDPLNLVPACSDCNHTKGDLVPSSPDRTPLHPYFDRVDGAAWLHARVLQDSPVRLEFFPDPPPSWGATLVARVAHHFELFDLAKLYAVQANRTISGIRQQLARLREAGNRETVRSYLREEADTRLAERPNGWEGVTYRTLAADDSFCDGGFAQTEFRDLRPATAVPCTRLP